MRHRKLLSVLALLMVGVSPVANAADEPIKFKIATLAPDGTSWMDNMYDVLGHIEGNSPVPVDFVVYSGGVMGDEPDMVRKLKFGQIQFVGVSVTGLSMLVPEIMVMSMPFMFKNYDEVDYVFKKMLPVFQAKARERGYILFGISDAGFFDLYSKNRIESADDIANQRVWTWNANPMDIPEKEALGITGHPVGAPEVLTSLQTGLLDTAFVAPVPVVAFQWHTLFKYYYPIRIRYETGGLVASAKVLDKMPAAKRDKFVAVLNDAAETWVRPFTLQTRKDEQETIAALKEFGIQEVNWPESELEKMKTKTRVVWDGAAEKYFSKEILDQVIGHLADYRTGKGN